MADTLIRSININESRTDLHPRTFSLLLPVEGRSASLFGVIDLRGIDGNIEPLLNLFLEQIEHSANLSMVQSHLQHRFEHLVQTMNEEIALAAEQQGWDFEAHEVNALIGVAGEDQLYLTGVGDLTALFLHKNEEQRYKVFNLFRGIQTEHHIPEWSKLFSVVLDGTLSSGDVFLVGNKEIPQQLDAEELNAILTSLPPKSSAEKIRQYFPAPTDLSLLVIGAEEALDTERMNPATAASSLNHLSRTQDTTSRMLEHQRPRKQDWIHAVKEGAKTTSAIIVSAVNVALALLMGIIKTGIASIRSLGTSRPSGTPERLKSSWQGHLKPLGNSIARLPKTNKSLLSITGGVAVILLVAGGFTYLHKKSARETAAYAALVSDIEQTLDTASASIIYKDENQARALLLQGLDSIAQLPTKKKDQQETVTRLQEEFSARLADLRHSVPVTSLELLASLPEGETAAWLGFDKTTTYVFTTNGTVYTYKAADSHLERLDVSAPTGFGSPTRSRYDDVNNVLYLFDGREVARFDPDQLTYEMASVANLPEGSVDIDFYGRRLYTLSPENEQVYRHERSGSGFGSGSGWIQARTSPLRDAVSFSIDGSVWILKKEGTIVRYQKGLEETWNTPTIDPTIGEGATLFTTDTSTALYIMDPANKRILQLEKSSRKLLAQFEHEAFDHLSGLLEQERTLTVLTPSGLYKFTF